MSSKLRIIHILLSRGFAGTERSTVESCNSQCHDHDVLLVIRRNQAKPSGACISIHLDPRVKVIEIPYLFGTLKSLQTIINDWNPDIVHAHLRRATRLLARCTTNAAKISTLHIGVNGPQFLEMDALVVISPWQLETVPPEYQGLVRWIRNSLISHPKPDSKKTIKLRQELKANDSTFLIGGVGRLSKSKGWDVLIEAFKIAQLKNSRLAIIGDGSEKGKLKKLANNSNIEFYGFKSDVKDYYSAFDVFVCPSREEPMGRVILEALDAGVAVIASDIEGPKDILNEYSGTLFPVEDAKSLAVALQDAQHQSSSVDLDLSPHFIENVSLQMIEFYKEAILSKRK